MLLVLYAPFYFPTDLPHYRQVCMSGSPRPTISAVMPEQQQPSAVLQFRPSKIAWALPLPIQPNSAFNQKLLCSDPW